MSTRNLCGFCFWLVHVLMTAAAMLAMFTELPAYWSQKWIYKGCMAALSNQSRVIYYEEAVPGLCTDVVTHCGSLPAPAFCCFGLSVWFFVVTCYTYYLEEREKDVPRELCDDFPYHHQIQLLSSRSQYNAAMHS
jgi:hypothetical protein